MGEVTERYRREEQADREAFPAVYQRAIRKRWQRVLAAMKDAEV